MSCYKSFLGSSHKFEPRYDEIPDAKMIPLLHGAEAKGPAAMQLLKSVVRKVYVCDVCVRCGEAVYPKRKEAKRTTFCMEDCTCAREFGEPVCTDSGGQQ